MSLQSAPPPRCSIRGSSLARSVPSTNLFSLDILEVESLMRFLCRCHLMTNGSWKPRRIMQISAIAENLILEIILVYFSSPATPLSRRQARVSRSIKIVSKKIILSLCRICRKLWTNAIHQALNETQTPHRLHPRPSSHRATCHSVGTSSNPPITL